MKSGAKGAVAGGGVVAAIVLASQFIGGLDTLGVATDKEIADLPTKAELLEMLAPIKAELEELKTAEGKTDERVRAISTNLAAFEGAWIQWKDSQ